MLHKLKLHFLKINIRLGNISYARQLLKQQTPKTQSQPIKNIYTDLSVISMNDAGTGIQRLVKSVWSRLPKHAPNLNFYPIYATRKKKYALSQYPQKNIKKRQYVNLKSGDLFFGLDWSADQIIKHQVRLMTWKIKGSKQVFILNDILALQHPEWFTAKNRQKLQAWLNVIAVCADEIICVSETVKKQVLQYLHEHQIDDLPCSAIKLGGEISPSTYTAQIRPEFEQKFLASSYILKVSTIEPRKGHLCLIQAFEALLKRYPDYPHHLYLVGRYGWKSEHTLQYLKASPYFGTRIFWWDDMNDAELNLLYQHTVGAVNCSYGEGFGLPLMEAIYYQKPLLVRDLPVFREVSSNQANYFQQDKPDALAETLYVWSKDLNSSSTHIIPLTSWDVSVEKIMQILQKHGVPITA
ncbi:glycosyltransferase family 1 protein [Acinetobacter sp. SWAC5]|uniref:glycosyltransferase family 4 protein n=1 Tax=Acinetobacter sp. SWAC5 TaxID=2293835 RepID=UPI00148DF939|nr:glycosyltransferase family 1 protein [Acinetobacter sp. SWAC5]